MFTLIDRSLVSSLETVSTHLTLTTARRALARHAKKHPDHDAVVEATTYTVVRSDGAKREFNSLVEAKRWSLSGTGAKAAHTCDWFLVPQGDDDVQQTLVWSSKKEAHNDDGRRSVASITRTVHVVGGDQ